MGMFKNKILEKPSRFHREQLDSLFDRYYQSAPKSQVTSSHWEKYGSCSWVERSNDTFTVSGFGFGHFVRPKTLRHIKYFLPSVLARQLLSRYGVSKETKAAGLDLAKRQDRLLLYDEVKQIIIADILKKQDIIKKSNTIAVIGDGFGFMACLLRLLAPQAKIICVNLGKILFFDLLYAAKVFPETKMFLIHNGDDYKKVLEQDSIIFMEAEKYEMLLGKQIDLFINIESMQEMDPAIIRTYFDIIRSSTGLRYFYACNRQEKVLPDGTVVRFDEYPWDLNKDEIIIDERCPFTEKHPISKPPFWAPFDGPNQHRLARMGQRAFTPV